jgi:hypothetical protein
MDEDGTYFIRQDFSSLSNNDFFYGDGRAKELFFQILHQTVYLYALSAISYGNNNAILLDNNSGALDNRDHIGLRIGESRNGQTFLSVYRYSWIYTITFMDNRSYKDYEIWPLEIRYRLDNINDALELTNDFIDLIRKAINQ